MTDRQAVIRTIRRQSDLLDHGYSDIDVCQLCRHSGGYPCRNCLCVKVFGATCHGNIREGRNTTDRDEYWPQTLEEKLMAACMMAAVLGIRV